MPRISHPSASLLREPRVAPQLRISSCACRCSPRVAPVSASSGSAGDGYSSCPEPRVLRCLWRRNLRLPLGSALPAAPPGAVASCPALCTFRLCLGFESPGCPEHSLLRRRLMVHRVASVPAPSGFAAPASSSCPESCICGWIDDDSRFSSNFASSASCG